MKVTRFGNRGEWGFGIAWNWHDGYVLPWRRTINYEGPTIRFGFGPFLFRLDL